MNKLTITILTSKERITEAEKIFLDLVNKKEAQEDWECIGHRIFRKNEFMNTIYIFQNMKTGEVHTLELFDSSFQSIQGQTFDNVICLDDRLTEEVKKRTLGHLIIL